MFDGDLISRCELFDETDLDAAIARFEELHPRARLENAATRVDQQLFALFVERRWEEMGALYADDLLLDDRRQGLRRLSTDRATQINNVRAIADLGVADITQTPLALRGSRLCLSHVQYDIGDSRPDAFVAEMLAITEVDTAGVMVARIVFGLDDFEAAVAELDRRYIAGEGAAHANTWSLIAQAFTALNRHELDKLPATTPGYRIYDHRLQSTVEAADLTALFRAMWDLTPELLMYVEAVHRLNDHGALITQGAHGTSRDGFDAQWRMIQLLTVEGELGTHCELFDEKDIDTAIARFEQLSLPSRRLENAASLANKRFWTYFAAHNWDALAEILTDDFSSDDRRRMVGAGVRYGRNAQIEDLRAIADLGLTNVTSTVMAIRGERLILGRIRFTGDQGPEALLTEILGLLEINANNKIRATVVFDPDDIEAAIAELDARYLAGEAAMHSETWSVVAGAVAAINRHELPELTSDWVNIDHRRAVAFAPGEMTEYVRAILDDASDLGVYIEAVHRLTNLGTVVTQASHATSHQGFDAEWRMISLSTVDGDLINRCELFDEADLDTALAKFEQLTRPAPQLENAATRVIERVQASLAAHDWDAIAEIMADDISDDDRRRAVNAGIRRGSQAEIENMRAIADLGATVTTSDVIATRGDRLALVRIRVSIRDQEASAFDFESLNIVEIDTDDRIAAIVTLDHDDIDSAFEELDARYRAGEAAGHAHTWSLIAQAYAGFNRGELPAAVQDGITVDHRHVAAMAPGEGIEYFRASWELAAELSVYIESVHRLSDLGAVFTHVGKGTSREGFEAEWRTVDIMTVDGDLISRGELFDEADLDSALAKFEELHPQAPTLENAASQVNQQFWNSFAARNWDGMAELLADDISTDDRRRVVNAGIQRGRDVEIENMRALADVGANMSVTVIATRGKRLELSRLYTSNRDLQHGEFGIELLSVVEIDDDDRIAAGVIFDHDDIDAAFEELDARYLAGEATAHAQSWRFITSAIANAQPARNALDDK